MFRRLACCVAIVSTSLVGLAALAPSSALPTAAAQPTVVIDPTSGPPGTDITVTIPGCTGFVVAVLAPIDAMSEADFLDFNESDGDHTTLTVPEGTPSGEYLVVAGCDVYDINDFNAVAFTVTPAPVVVQPTFTG